MSLKGKPRGLKGDAEMGPTTHMEGLRRREGTHGKKGITQEKVSLGIV